LCPSSTIDGALTPFVLLVIDQGPRPLPHVPHFLVQLVRQDQELSSSMEPFVHLDAERRTK
jgi:hypothetical protein